MYSVFENLSAMSITINVDHLELSKDSRISTQNNGSGDTGGITVHVSRELNLFGNSSIDVRAEQSNAGSIEIQSGNLALKSGSRITGDAGVNGGNISLAIDDSLYLINSEITAEAANDGGNITSESQAIILESSQLKANAINDDGGDIKIQGPSLIRFTDSTVTAQAQKNGG